MRTETTQQNHIISPYALPEEDAPCLCGSSANWIRKGYSLIERIQDAISEALQRTVAFFIRLKELAVGAFKGYAVDCLPKSEKSNFLDKLFTLRFALFCYRKEKKKQIASSSSPTYKKT